MSSALQSSLASWTTLRKSAVWLACTHRVVKPAIWHFSGLFALQHRGQESAGIAATNGEGITVHTDMGLVSQIFRESDFYPLAGEMAIGHTRYSTTGTSHVRNAPRQS